MPPLAILSCPDSPSTSESPARHFDSLDKLSATSTTVQFVLDRNEVTLIPTLDEFTPEEISNCYYNAGDFKRMKSQDRVLLRLLKKGCFGSSTTGTSVISIKDHCLRGIEQDSSREARQIRIKMVQGIVLSTKHQSRMDEDAACALAEKLAKATQYSKQEALSRARGDAAAALEV